MAKKWADVAASAAFQSLSAQEQEEARRQYFEDVVAPQVPEQDLDAVRSQFDSETRIARRDLPADVTPSDAGGGRGSINPPMAKGPGLLDRALDTAKEIGNAILGRDPNPTVREGRSVMDGYEPTPEERQANVDRRLSYGAGPISTNAITEATKVIDTGVKSDSPVVNKVAREMVRRGEQTLKQTVDRMKATDPATYEEAAASQSRKDFAEENPMTSALASGSAAALAGAINIPSVAADFVNQSAINPVLRALGMDELPRAPTAFGTEYLMKSASDFMPKEGRESMSSAWNRDDFAKWLGVKMAANTPSIAQSLAAMMAPPLRAALLPAMGAQAAGSSFVEGDDSRVAAAKGLIEVGTEMLPLHVFDKLGDVLKNMGPTKSSAVLSVATQRLLEAGGVITASSLINAVQEAAAQLGGNALDKYFQGKDVELTKGVDEAAVIGAATGKVFAAPHVVGIATGKFEPSAQFADALNDSIKNAEWVDPAWMRDGRGETETFDAEQMARDRGFLTSRAPTNFTPADSPTGRAGLAPIVVPDVTPANDDEVALPTINPDTEREFGLDKLRKGETDVGTTGATTPIAGEGGSVAGDQLSGGVGLAGRDAGDAQGTALAAAVGAAPVDGQAAAAGRDAAQRSASLTPENNIANTEPVEQWFGRRGDGYQTEADAQQALPGRQRMFPTLDWSVEPMPSGKFRLAGYSKETPDVTQATQAKQAEAQGSQAPATGDAGAATAGVLRDARPADSQRIRETVQPELDRIGAGIKLQAPTKQAEKNISEISAALGQAFGFSNPVVAFHDPSAPNGFEYRGQAFVNTADVEIGVHRTALHEVKHVIESIAEADTKAGKQGTASQKFIEQIHGIFDEMSDEGKRSYVENYLHKRDLEGLTGEQREDAIQKFLKGDKLRSEMTADFMGNRANDRKFLADLAAKDPKGFKPFVEKWIGVIDSLLKRLSGAAKQDQSPQARVDEAIKDLNKAKMVARDALIAFRKGRLAEQAGSSQATSEIKLSERKDEPQIGREMRARIEANYEGAKREYAKLKETEGGKILDADQARELSPEYRADKSRAMEVHEASSDFVQRMFDERMSQPDPNDDVVFMAGGGGAGKSSAKGLLSPIMAGASTVLDGTLSTYSKAEANVQKALDSGRNVNIVYIYRNPVNALTNGVLTRAMENGRTVPVDALVKGHAGSSTVVRQLQEKFGNNPRFKIHVIDNSLGFGKAKISSLENVTPVIKSGLKERFIDATNQEYAAGRISDTVHRATIGSNADAGAGTEVEAANAGVRAQAAGADEGRDRSERAGDSVRNSERSRVGSVDTHVLQAERGTRAESKVGRLSEEEKAIIKDAAAELKVSAADLEQKVRTNKKAHPASDGWASLKLVKVEADDNGKPELVYQTIPYQFNLGADGKSLQPGTAEYESKVATISQAMQREVRSVYDRAVAGDKAAKNIIAQSGWYKEMRTRLRQEFGGLGDLFADLLGATSPNTPVRTNWDNSIEALRLATSGAFDELMPKWEAWFSRLDEAERQFRVFFNDMLDQGMTKAAIKKTGEYKWWMSRMREYRDFPDELLPLKSNGKKFGFNGYNAVRAMVDLWRVVKNADADIARGGTAPKAINFSGNLIGFRSRATIDVWAARMLQRLAGGLRIPSMAEGGVSGEALENGNNTLQFGFGQDVFTKSVDLIRNDPELQKDPVLAEINDDDLQALVWFIEKEVWTKGNWTSAAGEGGSFEFESDLAGIADRERVNELRKVADSSVASTAKERADAEQAIADATAKMKEMTAEQDAIIDKNADAVIANKAAPKDQKLTKDQVEALRQSTAEAREKIKSIKASAAYQKQADIVKKAKTVFQKPTQEDRQKMRADAVAELGKMSRTLDRYTLGLSIQKGAEQGMEPTVPSDAEMAGLAQSIVDSVVKSDSGATVIAMKAIASEGRYGSVERTLDAEFLVREGFNAKPLAAATFSAAQDADQDAAFVARVLRPDEDFDPLLHRPGIEIYFRDMKQAQEAARIMAGVMETKIGKTAEEGPSFFAVGGYTVVVDGRSTASAKAGKMGRPVGMRVIYMPEFEARYGLDPRLENATKDNIRDIVNDRARDLGRFADEILRRFDGVSFAGRFNYEVDTRFAGEYQGAINDYTSATTGEGADLGRVGTWQGRSVLESIAAATGRLSLDAGEPGAAVSGGVDSTVRLSARAAGLAEPAGRSRARADAEDGSTVTGIHYGKAGNLSQLNGTSYGSGIKGAEAARLREPGTDPRIKKRVYFYLTNNNADMPRPEEGLGNHVYRATLGNMFDPDRASPAAVQRVNSLRQGVGANAFESAVLDAGYRGYVSRALNMAVVLNSNVPVAYEGTADASRFRNQGNGAISSERATRTEGGELVLRPTNEEMLGIIKARPALAAAAPSFRLEYGEARVSAEDAAAANAALEEAGAAFRFSQRAQTETPAFKRWFGDSKVVDENGEPLVVYHASKKKGVTVFSPEYKTELSSMGFHFGTKEQATFRTGQYDFESSQPDMGEYYLRIVNPLEVSHMASYAPDHLADQMIDMGLLEDGQYADIQSSAEYDSVQTGDALVAILKGAGYDGLVYANEKEGAGKSYVPFDSTQIKSATGNNGNFDPTNPDIRRSQRSRDSWLFGRDEAGRVTLGAGAKAYRLVADLANTVLAKMSLKPIDKDLAKAMRKMKVEIAKARELTADVAGKLGELSEDERVMISDVIEGELKRGAKPPKRVLEIAASMQNIMSEQTAELVRLGMLTPEAAGRWDGKYLPRFYESKLLDEGKKWIKAAKAMLGKPRVMQGIGGSNLKGRGIFQTIPVEELEAWLAEGWEERDSNFDPAVDDTIVVWRDYTRQERDDMGEIRDAMFRFVMGYNKSQRDISLGRLYESLANTVASRKQEDPSWVQVPSSTIEDTAHARRYGKLSGKWVPKEVFDHLSSFDQSMQNEVLKMYLKGLSMWKEGKTVLNPVSHVNNVLSNITMAHFAGVSYWDANKYVGAARDLIKNDPMVQEAKDAGLWLGTMTQAELINLLPDQLKVLAAKTESKAGQAVEGVWNALSFFLRKPLGKAYKAEDLFFRYMIYRDARQQGMTPDEATDYAGRYIFNYDDLPKGARMVRDFGLPFFSYTFKVVPALARTALETPWRYAAPAALLYTVNAAMYAIAAGAGGDDDWWELIKRYMTDEDYRKKAKALEADERKYLPEWMKGASLTLGTSKAIRLGMDEALGMPLFLDVSRIFPGGDLFDANNNAGGIPLFAPITPNNPILTTASALLFNKDTFTGRELVKMTDTSAEAAAKRGEWAWKQFSPAIAVGNYHFDRAMNVLANQVGSPINLGFKEYTGTDSQGLPVEAKYAVPQMLGIKIRPYDLDTSAAIQKAEKQKMIRELDAEIRRIDRLERKGAITDTQADTQRERQKEKRQRLRDGLTVDGKELD